MSTTYLPTKHLGYPAFGDSGASWTSAINASLANVDSAFGGLQTFSLGAASGTISVNANVYNGAYPANVASYIPLSWTLTGTLTANVNLQIPASTGGLWIVNNLCTMGSYTVTFSAASGSTSATLSTGIQIVYSDGVGNISIATPALSSYAPIASPTFTGTPAAPTASPGTNTTQLATTAFVATSFAPLASPALTGTPTAPTQSVNDNSTNVATTAYVSTQITAQLAPSPLAITGGIPTAMTGTNTTASITVSASTATDITATVGISYAGGTWAVSNGNAINGYSGGATLPNSSTINVYLCKGGSGTGLYASTVFGLSAGSAPTGYTSYIRRLFSFTTDVAGSPIGYTAFESSGGGYIAYLKAAIHDVNAVTIPLSKTNYSVSVPSGMRVQYIARASTSDAIYIFGPDEATPSSSIFSYFPNLSITTNTSAQISAISFVGTYPTDVYARGFEDFRRA